jgi:hypothetical protein
MAYNNHQYVLLKKKKNNNKQSTGVCAMAHVSHTAKMGVYLQRNCLPEIGVERIKPRILGISM